MALSVLISAWLVGTLGGLHCVAMCGGLLSAVAARDGAARPLLPARALVRSQAAYHAGRIATYALLGAAFGATGEAALTATGFMPLQRGLYLAANVFLLALGVSIAVGGTGIPWLQRAGATVFARALTGLSPLLRGSGNGARIALGFAWGLVPCALVYSVLPLSLFAGGAWQGAAVMLAFGLGTLPNLLAAGFLLTRTRRLLRERGLRSVAAAVLIGFGLLGFWRVLYDPQALARGPFCVLM